MKNTNIIVQLLSSRAIGSKEIRMKVVYTTFIIFVVGNLKTCHNNIEKKIWEVVWEYMGVFNNMTVFHPDCGLNIVSPLYTDGFLKLSSIL